MPDDQTPCLQGKTSCRRYRRGPRIGVNTPARKSALGGRVGSTLDTVHPACQSARAVWAGPHDGSGPFIYPTEDVRSPPLATHLNFVLVAMVAVPSASCVVV